MAEAVPGLEKASAEYTALLGRFLVLHDEGNGCNERARVSAEKVEALQAQALQGKDVDLLQASILMQIYEENRSRRSAIMAEIADIEREMDSILAKVGKGVSAAMQRHAAICRAQQALGGHA